MYLGTLNVCPDGLNGVKGHHQDDDFCSVNWCTIVNTLLGIDIEKQFIINQLNSSIRLVTPFAGTVLSVHSC